MSPKLWSERDFDECCYALSGVSSETMVCAEPCHGSYCTKHRDLLDAMFTRRPRALANVDRRNRRRKLGIKARGRKTPKPKAPYVGPTAREILAKAAEDHGVGVEDITADIRAGRIVRARQDFMWRCRQAFRMDGTHRYSFPQIASVIRDGMDHSTVMFGVRAHAKRVGASI